MAGGDRAIPPPAGVNMMMRKIAVAAASKPAVEIKQENDDTFYIKTSTTVRTTEINFKIGEEFEEQTVDGRPCKSLVKWESENKMVCEQRLLKGEGPKTSWSRELTNDGELILVSPAPSHLLEEPLLPTVVCAQGSGHTPHPPNGGCLEIRREYEYPRSSSLLEFSASAGSLSPLLLFNP
eukprot:XP_017446881.1 PREDICTED: cellular retinoic acid-binding protein 2-like [Rattus norvegicus]